ncbi:molybdopterin-dependent oxidoreductase [Aliiglaciecola sp. CAU 1673]|uniref:xanthine dehydrogenase family protein molybdopterin-binding subunit n=1 Tax=Aliiglaciecola sp. CAU 1673 TaxID=3032595 RepID=UPI0023DB3AFA|nr:molybdopterin cofactor-binding domain-containing protein [Aliiglaciecola sp. CAU 1673]MDF2176856.1 molybdopterin-dependent oxidoreductase [Aliiglaciecola sp. CAU 1673]
MDRRRFLKIYFTCTAAIALPTLRPWGKLSAAEAIDTSLLESQPRGNLTSFIQIAASGEVSLFINQQEMGQGVRTSIAQLLCEELDYPPEQVTLIQAHASAGHFGTQLTGGSGAIRRSWMPMRKAGAAAKLMLRQAAALAWQVDVARCEARNGKIWLEGTEESLGYGDLVAVAAGLPVPEDPPLKSSKAFRYIGHSIGNLDAEQIVSGKIHFGADVKLPGMRYAVLLRSPTLMGTVDKILNPNVLTEAIDSYIQSPQPLTEEMPQTREAVVLTGPHLWPLLKAKKALQVKWHSGEVHFQDSLQQQQALIEKTTQAGVQVRNLNRTLSPNEADLVATYYTPMQYQAQLEPMTSTVLISGNKQQCTVWAPIQWPQFMQKSVATFLGISEANVLVHPIRMGGSFGRKYCDDFVIECVAIALKYPGTPVQVQWTREDDMQCGGPQIPCAHLLAARLDNKNRISDWLHRMVQASTSVTTPTADAWQAEHGQVPLPYEIENISCEFNAIPGDMDTTAHRAVFYPTNAFAINSFLDEVARKLNVTTIELHQELLSRKPRLDFADWHTTLPEHLVFKPERLQGVMSTLESFASPKPNNHGRGFALQRAMFSYVAAYVDVKINAGELQVTDVYCVIDCGRVINPDGARAQIEGSLIWGLSTALFEELTMKNGVIEQQNFHQYQVARMAQIPRLHIRFVESEIDPTGLGEPAVTVMAPALANAVFDLTGQRIRALPLMKYFDKAG